MSKLTLIITVRASDFSDYAKRLKLRDALDLAEVETIIVDDGSPEAVSPQVESFCSERGYKYVRLQTEEFPFSLSRARNAGIDASCTEWICFEDIDLAYRSDFYQRLMRELQLLDETPFNFLTVPAVYLSAAQSDRVFANGMDAEYERALTGALLENPRGHDVNSSLQHYAPASSVIAVRRKTALYVGAFDENFAGWGGEDRDFVFRLLLLNNRIEKPNDFQITKTWNLNDTTQFDGWRALYRMHGDYLARKGMYAFHLFHDPLPWRNGQSNIKLASEKAERFHTTKKVPTRRDPHQPPDIIVGFNPHIANEAILQSVANPTIIDENGRADPERFAADIAEQNPRSVLMWNPYGLPWRKKVYDALRNLGIDPVVGERGALPRSLYFDKGGLCIESPSYQEQYWAKPLTEEQEQSVKAYIDDMRFGEHALEKQSGRVGAALLRHRLEIGDRAKVLFVPLQLADDTVTTLFSEKRREYDAYLLELKRLSLSLPSDWVMVYKNHPLAVQKFELSSAVCADAYHVHDLLEAASAVALFNSGVGVISMAFNKRVFYYGPCFYAIGGVNEPFNDAAQMADKLRNLAPVDKNKVYQFFHYLLNEFYSFADWKADVAPFSNFSNRTKVKDIKYTEVRISGYAPAFYQYPAFDLRRSVLFDPYRHHASLNGGTSNTQRNGAATVAATSIAEFVTSGRFTEAAAHFEAAYAKNKLRPNLLRSAAEMYVRAGNHEKAVAHLKTAAKQLPGNLKVRKRLLVLKYPFLKRVIGENEFPVGNF
ncbi:glycosyltransferase [Sinorhizobium medicae]|uniref:glycosyltransferase n=1 Tax=Sinorhizobium medicae TaxID=110321 RepID=UPI000FDBBEA7|nr:glycosyltransferase [Sinorhizobium medicae]MDX0439104.1 glycosyltransferase [Sinorhizobium medicae]MDX0617483.1 glycosyltransferase [Sinorhizobium medicae]MDX0654574.1 glycosyltransferase [Sinorhizobium medicae]MDX0703897.1 glycosyltransferase [Sinorhizobium medicae]MDX0760292.1 glycosyltransferase [Sinorhizobium medicae]